jgi:phosphatidate cytidylyltransferase
MRLRNTTGASAGLAASSPRRDLEAVAETLPAGDPGSSQRSRRVGELSLRVVSSLALAPLVLAAAYVGGWLFLLFWTLAAAGVWWEWTRLVGGSEFRAVRPAGVVTLAAAAALLAGRKPELALLAVAAGASVAVMLVPAGHRGWTGSGVAYAAVLVVAPAVLRGDASYGLPAILLLFAVVWTTDIVAYFAGRKIGGPKVWPRVSPKKTWSGALIGTLAAILVGLIVGRAAGIENWPALVGLAFVLAVACQAGDLFESAVKRRFSAKDAGTLIPGHGGLMDRLDGFVAAALVAMVIGVSRGGIEAPARGLLIW